MDETTDTGNKEQVVVRWVDDSFEVHEDFIGLYVTDSTTAKAIVKIIVETLRLNLKLENC